MIKLEVGYSAELIKNDAAYDHKRLIVGEQRLEHLSPTVAVFISALPVSLTLAQQIASANHKDDSHEQRYQRKPVRSLSPPKAPTSSMVNIAMSAEPTPAQVRPTTDRFSRSAGVRVTAGSSTSKECPSSCR